MIKVIIANDNDILYNRLSNFSLQNELNIEIKNVAKNELKNIIHKIKTKDNVIILDSATSVTFLQNVMKNATLKIDTRKLNIIILVIDSNSQKYINQKYHHFFKNQKTTTLFDVVELISNSLKDSLELEKKLDDLLWELGFTSYFKGTMYLKDAILFVYEDKSLLYDMGKLINKVSKKNHKKNQSVIRSDIDKALNHMLDYIEPNSISEIFEDYDGRKISLKYFIDLVVRYLEKQRYCCLN